MTARANRSYPVWSGGSAIPVHRTSLARLAIISLIAAFLLAVPGPAQASSSVSKAAPKAGASASCAALKRKARVSKRGSAKRRRYQRRYRKCRARARARARARKRAASPRPQPTPGPSPGSPPRPVYLPSVSPNPNGYRRGDPCQPGDGKPYRAAGFACAYRMPATFMVWDDASGTWVPGPDEYWLQGLWRCPDGQVRQRC